MKKVYIMGACRTPIGKMGGALASVSAVDLGLIVIKEALKCFNIPSDQVDHVYMGCVIQAGLGQNAARQAAIKAGLPVTSTAETLNVVCGSGLDAVNSAARMIQTREADIVIAGGMESMSKAPFALQDARFDYRIGSPMINTPTVDTMVNDALWDAINNYHMGITSENVAEKYGITREELDAFAARSQQKASDAIASGKFKHEIVPVIIKRRKGDTVVDTDEGPRSGTTASSLAKLKPAFKQDGIVTAGNSSGINDGAAAVVMVSEDKVKELGLNPQAEWIGGALGGVDPSIMDIGSVASTTKLLSRLNISMGNLDLIEANEAFAAQSLVVKRDLEIPEDKRILLLVEISCFFLRREAA